MESKLEHLSSLISEEYRDVVNDFLSSSDQPMHTVKRDSLSDEDKVIRLFWSFNFPRPRHRRCNIPGSDQFLPFIAQELELDQLPQPTLIRLWNDHLKDISADLLVYMLALAVVRDERIKARKILQLEPLLGFERCDVVSDYSMRNFYGRSPWELCLWTLNTWYMGNIFLGQMSTPDMRMKALEQLGDVKQKGYYNPDHLFSLMREYALQENWDEQRRTSFLCNKIAPQQRLLPAHFARHLCNLSEAFTFQDYNNSNPNSFFNRMVTNRFDSFNSDEPIEAYSWSSQRYFPFYTKTPLSFGNGLPVVRSGMWRSWGGAGNNIATFVNDARPCSVMSDFLILSGIHEKRLADLNDLEKQLQEPLSEQSCSIS